jgi:hypothetical protein
MFMSYEQVSRRLSQLGKCATASYVKRLVQEGELKAVRLPEGVRIGSISPLVIEVEEFERYLKEKGYIAES